MGTQPRYNEGSTAAPSPWFERDAHLAQFNGGSNHPSHNPMDWDMGSPELLAELKEQAQETGSKALKALEM